MSAMERPAPAGAAPPRGGSRWLIGCLGVVLVLFVLIGVAGWWFVIRPFQQMAAAVQEVATIQQLDQRVTRTDPYTPPEDGELSDEQMARYVRVLRGVRDDLDARFVELQRRYEDIGGRQPQLMDVPRLASAYVDLIRLLVRAKEAQVAALNAEDFSLEEYRWVRGQVLVAAGMQGAGYDLSSFVQALADGRDPTAPPPAPSAAPAANRQLVQDHAEELNDLAFLALLGL